MKLHTVVKRLEGLQLISLNVLTFKFGLKIVIL